MNEFEKLHKCMSDKISETAITKYSHSSLGYGDPQLEPNSDVPLLCALRNPLAWEIRSVKETAFAFGFALIRAVAVVRQRPRDGAGDETRRHDLCLLISTIHKLLLAIEYVAPIHRARQARAGSRHDAYFGSDHNCGFTSNPVGHLRRVDEAGLGRRLVQALQLAIHTCTQQNTCFLPPLSPLRGLMLRFFMPGSVFAERFPAILGEGQQPENQAASALRVKLVKESWPPNGQLHGVACNVY